MVVVVLVVLGVLGGDLSILSSIYETQISQRDEAPWAKISFTARDVVALVVVLVVLLNVLRRDISSLSLSSVCCAQ